MDAHAGGDGLRRAHALHEIAARRGLVVQSSSGIQRRSWLQSSPALVAQLDRAPDFESGGRGFESLRARQLRHFVQPELPAQPVDATQALNFSAGVSNPRVLRVRSLSWRATLLRLAC